MPFEKIFKEIEKCDDCKKNPSFICKFHEKVCQENVKNVTNIFMKLKIFQHIIVKEIIKMTDIILIGIWEIYQKISLNCLYLLYI